MELTVWAPTATGVELLIGEERRALTRSADGHWHGDVWPGVDYMLSVDGGPARPDPRSMWQPHGVHGPSRSFDVTTHPWGDTHWGGIDAIGKVIYELHLGTFTPAGTLDAAVAKLPILVELGVEVVELMPVAAFPGNRGWGYDGVGPFSVHEAYGGPAALQRFVDAAHGYGLGVCLDVVYNHLGPAGNYLQEFAPYFTPEHATPWGWAVNFDQAENENVRRYFIDTAIQWFRDFHIDALRLDAIQTIKDHSDYRFLMQLTDEIRQLESALGRPLTIIGETDTNQPILIAPTSEGGDGLHGIWSDDFHHALHSYLTGEDFGYYEDFSGAGDLIKVLERTFTLDGRHSPFHGGNWGAPVPPGTDRRRFIACTQNHDQVGNRALGDRPDATLPPGAVAGGVALLLLSPFTPLLFQGQEWGTKTPFQYFTDHDEELGKAVSEGRKRDFAMFDWVSRVGPDGFPDPQDPATFHRSKLDWDELRSPEHARMWAWHHDLIALRRETFGDGVSEQHVTAEAGDGWFSIRRGPLTVVLVPGDEPVTVPVAGERVLEFGDVAPDGAGGLVVGPHAVVVLRH